MGDVLGIDLGCSATKWVLLRGAEIVDRGTVPTPGDRDAIVEALIAITKQRPAEGVGIGVPGHVTRATGVTTFLPNLPGDWAGFPLGATVGATVLNDARAFCLAELRLGAARGMRNGLFLTLGTGVGGGVVRDGALLVGPDDRLGEIGHLTYDRTGPRCGCGNRGCLEMYASGPAIGGEAVFAAAQRGKKEAVEAVDRAGRAIGETVASLCAVLPSEQLVVGGGVAASLPLLRPAIEKALAERRDFIGPVTVVGAELGVEAGAIGAAFAAAEARGEVRELDRTRA